MSRPSIEQLKALKSQLDRFPGGPDRVDGREVIRTVYGVIRSGPFREIGKITTEVNNRLGKTHSATVTTAHVSWALKHLGDRKNSRGEWCGQLPEYVDV